MKILVKLPVMVSIGNNCAIFMAGIITATSHTKHVEIRYKNVNECVEEGIAKIVFVKSAENYNNILAKNLGRKLNDKHLKKTMVRSLNNFQWLEMFEYEWKGVKDNFSSFNI